MEERKDFVVIVSGLPRSGTSMMMRMLEAGGVPVIQDHVRTPDIDNPNGYYEFEPAKKTKEDPSWLEDAPGKVVKMVYQLLYDLPADRQYRVLFMRREMDEVLASQRKMLQRLGKPTDGVSDELMASMFRKQLAKFEEWIAAQPNFRVLDIGYNRIVDGPDELVAAINDFLGGGLDVASMRAVVDPSLYRNRVGATSA